MQVAVLCCGLVVSLVFGVSWCRSIPGFYVMFMTVMGLVAVPSLNVLLEENFVQWTISYVTQSYWKVRNYAFWLILSMFESTVCVYEDIFPLNIFSPNIY